MKVVPQGSAKGFSVFHGAPTIIVVANDTTNHYSEVDCGFIGTEYSARCRINGHRHLCGRGSVMHTCAHGSQRRIAQLNLPENFAPLYTISVGYPNEWPDAKPRDKAKVQVIK